MYRQHFSLEKKPFQISSDNEFLWLGKKHTTALELLKSGMTKKKGLLVLTGDIGTGKTTLVNEIIHTLPLGTLYVKIVDPCFEMYHLFEFIAQEFGFEYQHKEGKKFSSDFFPFVKTAESRGKKILVVVDEAHRMPNRFLKEIITWHESGPRQGLTIILAGQLEFQDVLRTHLGQNWKDHMTLCAHLEPLNDKETQMYITRRLEIAGARSKLFSVAAMHEAHGWSKGFPRLINISCDQALIAAFSKGMVIVDAPTFKQVIHDLDLPIGHSKHPKQNKEDNLIQHKQWFFKKKLGWLASTAAICSYIFYLFYTGHTPSAIKYAPPSSPAHLESPANQVKNAIPSSPAHLESPASQVKDATPSSPAHLESPASQVKDAIPSSPAHLESPANQVKNATPHAEPVSTKKTPKAEPALIEPLSPITSRIQEPADKEIGLGYTPAPSSEIIDYINTVSDADMTKNRRPQGAEKGKNKNLDQFIEDVFLLKKQTITFPEAPVKTKKEAVGEPAESRPGKDIHDFPVSSIPPEPDAIIEWLIEKRKKVKDGAKNDPFDR